jgi:hypothetical protein
MQQRESEVAEPKMEPAAGRSRNLFHGEGIFPYKLPSVDDASLTEEGMLDVGNDRSLSVVEL